jgi:hypothetical protein
VKNKIERETWDFRSDENSCHGLLGYDTLKVEAAYLSETLVSYGSLHGDITQMNSTWIQEKGSLSFSQSASYLVS